MVQLFTIGVMQIFETAQSLFRISSIEFADRRDDC